LQASAAKNNTRSDKMNRNKSHSYYRTFYSLPVVA